MKDDTGLSEHFTDHGTDLASIHFSFCYFCYFNPQLPMSNKVLQFDSNFFRTWQISWRGLRKERVFNFDGHRRL